MCGTVLDDIASPNDIEHELVSFRSKESLESLVGREIKESGKVDMWPEHWEDSGSVIVWKCSKCKRLYVDAEGDQEKVIVYKVEQYGIESDSRSTF